MMLWADVILLVHFLFVLFIVGGLLLIWIGAWLQWQWVKNFWFRVFHAAAMLFVVFESIIGAACPLTVWENNLRGEARELGFIQDWVSRLLFYDLAEWIFTLIYISIAVAILLTFRWLPLKDKHALFQHHIHR